MKKEIIEHKIETTLQSLDNVQRAEASPFLYSKIMNKLYNKSATEQTETRKFLRLSWELAFAMILFIGLNIVTFVYFTHKNDQDDNNSLTSLANEYTVNSNNYNYY